MAEDNPIPTKRISHPFMIGLFVIAGTLAVMAVVLWLGASKWFQEYQIYSTYIDGSVEGLDVGTPVKYQGIPVGHVRLIKMAPDGKLVQIDMEIDDEMQINDRLRVRMEMAGITGGKFLQLYYPDKPELMTAHPKLTFEPRYPVIPATPSGIQEIENAVNDIVNNLRAVEAGRISEETINLLRSARHLTDNPELDATIANLNRATASLDRLITQLESAGLGENLVATSRNISEASLAIKNTANNVSGQVSRLDLSGRADRVIATLDSLVYTTGGTVTKLGAKAETTIFTLRETLEEFRATNRQISRSLREITDNPGKAFLSEPPPAD